MKIKKVSLLLIVIILCGTLWACNNDQIVKKENYKGRVFYEIFVRAFSDSNGDGIGDLKGLNEKLDYLKNMGIGGVWLMPINESPSYHGYDVSDYYKINSDYGTMDDFKELIKEAHKKDIKVIMDLVLNHTSTENQWFKNASSEINSKDRDKYIWAKGDNLEEQISPMQTKPWTKLGDEYYYSIFSKNMPDLNYDNKDVRAEVKKIAKFYLDMGVDGFRLDAAKWIYNDDASNLVWWFEFNNYVKSVNKDAVLVGEVWDNNNGVINDYMCALDSCFNFPMADSVVKSISSGEVGMLVNGLQNVYDDYIEQNKEFKDSIFLTNHDQDRLMSKLKDENKVKEAAAIYLTLPGTPYIYYGEETGMTGQKPDENIREPFIWNNKEPKENSSWIRSTNDIDKVAVNVQINDKNSMLNFYKNIIGIRNNSAALQFGIFKAMATDSDQVVAYKRILGKEKVYVYVNTSNKELTEKIDVNKLEILYSNRRKDKNLEFKGNILLEPGEILIMK